MNDAAMSLRLPAPLKRELEALARATKRSRSFLVNEAIAGYVAQERKIVAGIKKARAELKAGQGIPHREAMREIEKAIAGANSKRGA